MILLILGVECTLESALLNLNSIMILLIYLDPDTVCIRNLKFKFHYDSINLTSFVLFTAHLNSFKFHYDSINFSHACELNLAQQI